MIMSTPSYFRQRYRMRRNLFLTIMRKLSESSLYFTKRHDATDHIGLTPLQKCIAALHQLAYDLTADIIYEYMKLGKSHCHFHRCSTNQLLGTG
jgi:hypothetical protein